MKAGIAVLQLYRCSSPTTARWHQALSSRLPLILFARQTECLPTQPMQVVFHFHAPHYFSNANLAMCVSYIRNRFIGLTILHDIPSVYSLAPYSNGSILFLSDSSFIVSPRLHAGRSALFDLVIFTCHPWLWRSHVVPPEWLRHYRQCGQLTSFQQLWRILWLGCVRILWPRPVISLPWNRRCKNVLFLIIVTFLSI